MVVGDLKGAVRLEKGKKQADCQQQSSTSKSENSESQRENEESTLRHGLKTNLKRSTRWVAGVRKVWGTRESESGNDVAREMVREEHDIRVEVIEFHRPDVVALVEEWLKGEEETVVEGYI